MGRDVRLPTSSAGWRNFNPLSPSGERPQRGPLPRREPLISIHSPRAGRDCRYPNAPLITQISIHSPRMGRDLLRGVPSEGQEYFNPLSPHGERPEKKFTLYDFSYISIHSPRMGRDAVRMRTASSGLAFQSTLPAWGETRSDD